MLSGTMAVAVQRAPARSPARASTSSPRGSALGSLVMVTAMTGCGLGVVGEEERGGARLPTQGAGPYGTLASDRDTPAEEPYVLSAFRVHLRDPAVLRRDDGGFRLWFSRVDVEAPEASEIWAAELPAITELPDVAPDPVLVADQAWEQGWVGAPSVVARPDGGLTMLYQGGRERLAVGRADSVDGGWTWQKHPDNPVLVDAAEPSAALVPGGIGGDHDEDASSLVVYMTRPGRDGIFRADSLDGVTWTSLPEPVLLPRRDVPDAYDRQAVSAPFVVVRRTASGTLHYGMFFNGTDRSGESAVVSIGWAGSFDGLEWRRPASPDEPVLASGGGNAHAPAVILEPDGGVMFFHEGQPGAQRIAVAVHP